MTKTKKVHYVDNKRFFEEIVKYRDRLHSAREAGLEDPRIPDYIGECIWKIAEKLSTKPCFMNYSYRDEMISDGIENCILYFKDYDPAIGQNPFAYFTQIVYYSFLRRIQREKKQLYVKYKSAEISGLVDEFNQLETEDGVTRQFELYDNISQFIESFETTRANKLDIKKQQKSAINLDIFVEDEESE